MPPTSSEIPASRTVSISLGIDFLGGYLPTELKFDFERHEFHLETEHKCAVIRTRIGIYIDDIRGIWYNGPEPIGYYLLEVDLDGEILDDYLTIEKKNES